MLNTLYLQNTYGDRKDVNIVTSGGLDSLITKNVVLEKKRKEIVEQNKKISEQDRNILTLFSFPDSFPVFVNVQEIIDQKLAKSIMFTPYGLGFKVAGQKEKALSKEEFINIQEKIWQKFKLDEDDFQKSVASLGYHMLDIQEQYAKSATNVGDYLLLFYNDVDASKKWYEKALRFYPYDGANKGLSYYYYTKNDCRTSEKYINENLYLNSKNKLAYKQLYLLYKNCYKDDKKAENIKKNIKEKFKVEI